jgi:hypothetical protein
VPLFALRIADGRGRPPHRERLQVVHHRGTEGTEKTAGVLFTKAVLRALCALCVSVVNLYDLKGPDVTKWVRR